MVRSQAITVFPFVLQRSSDEDSRGVILGEGAGAVAVEGAVDADRFEQAPGGLRCSSVAVTCRPAAHPEQYMRLDAIAIGHNPPEDVNVIVEVPIGGEPIKYEMDKAAGTLVVDRFLHTAMRYPGNYGFVPHTLSDDGDPIDVLIANTRPIVPGAIVNVRPVGVLKMEDDAGGDEKIIAVPVPKLTKRYAHITEYSQMPEITIQQIQHFFEHYKDLEPGKWVKVIGWGGADEARRFIADAIARAKAKDG
jgi:inorganic pyrophosphatase